MQSHIHVMQVCLAATSHLHFLAERPGSLCYCGNTGVERIPKYESALKVDPGEESFPSAPTETRARDLSTTSPVYH